MFISFVSHIIFKRGRRSDSVTHTLFRVRVRAWTEISCFSASTKVGRLGESLSFPQRQSCADTTTYCMSKMVFIQSHIISTNRTRQTEAYSKACAAARLSLGVLPL